MAAKILAEDSAVTLAAFEQDTLRVAQVLRERGVGLGSRVLLKAGNSASYVSVLFALMHVGASIVLLDQQERAEATGSVVRRSGAKLVLVDDDAPVPADVDPVHLYELISAAPEVRVTDEHLDFGAWSDLDDALIMWSSGSTGEPKGIVKNGGRFLRNLERNAHHMGHRADDVLLPLLPFSHQYGLSMVLIAWIVQGSLVIAPYKRLDRALRMAGPSGATVLDATPATYRSILGILRQKPALERSLGAVRMFCSGAAPSTRPSPTCTWSSSACRCWTATAAPRPATWPSRPRTTRSPAAGSWTACGSGSSTTRTTRCRPTWSANCWSRHRT